MINLDQVRTLEWKVKQAVQLIVQLRRENDMLRGRVSDTEVRLQELEAMLEAFKASQSEMESGIRSALDELDHLDSSGPAESASGATIVEPSVEVTAEAEQAEPDLVAEPVTAIELETEVQPLSTEADLELDADANFDEEYAALVAAEASSLVDAPETEAETAPAAENEAKPDNDREPEQPGLGIF